MELFKFNPGADPTVLERGEAINNAKSIMWAERYRDPGEFKIQASLSSGFVQFLPIGTLISHANTLEVMIVENHEISENQDEDSTLIITGRSLDSILDQRVVGTNQVRASTTPAEYALTADYTWNQAVKLINDHILNTTNANDQFGNIVAATNVAGTAVSTARTFKRDYVLKHLVELLKINDLGIRTLRRSTFPGGNNTQTTFLIYNGVDRTASVIFSWKEGDIDGADYLRSIKNFKTSALVFGRYVQIIVDGPETKLNRRMMILDASDIDNAMANPPVGTNLTDVIAKMTARAYSALGSQKQIGISRVDIAPSLRYIFREDYDIGDLVVLDGNFGTSAVMRVIEHVEIEDENGRSGHPTLAFPE